MKANILKAFFIATLAAALAFAVACGGDDDNDTPDNGAAGGGAAGGGTIPVTQALLDSLPEYEGATLVREWLAEQGGVQVREYAVDEAPESAADAVTQHFREALLADGWEESEARAAVSGFTKDGYRIVIGRVGPEIQEPPADATLLNSDDVPEGTGFFFTLEAEE